MRTGTCASNLTCGPGNIIIIAGGGGGQGSDNEAGGTGGGPTGGNGADGFNGVQNGAGGGGQGATQTSGGAGGGSSGGNGCGGGGGGSSFVTAGGTGATYHSGVTGTIGGGVITLTFLYDTITTSGPSAAAVAQNANVNDTVTVSGNNIDTPTGTVQFAICGPFQTAVGCSQASGSPLASATLSPNHDTNNTASTSSAPISEAKIGTYCFFANYVGDVNYNPSTDGSAEECFAVRGPSVTTSSPTKSTIQLGDTNTDGATSTGDGVTPTGTTQFSACGPTASTCTSGGSAVGPGILSGGTTTSPAFTPTALGSWCFRADYQGDVNYQSSSDGTGDECFTVTQADSTTVSTPADATIQLGDSTSDGVTISGNNVAGAPAGTVDFSVCGPMQSASPCTSGGTSIGSPTLTGAGAASSSVSSSSFTPAALGTYCYRADYGGDTNYTTSSDASPAECFTVAKADSDTASHPSSDATTMAAGASDQAVVSGLADGPRPTGAVRFLACGPLTSDSGCAAGSGIPIGSGPVALTSGSGQTAVARSATFLAPRPGIWCLRAEYLGDQHPPFRSAHLSSSRRPAPMASTPPRRCTTRWHLTTASRSQTSAAPATARSR